MTQLFSLEFLSVVLFIINLFLVILLILIVRRVNRLDLDRQVQEGCGPDTQGLDTASGSARDIIDMLAPLVRESKDAAISFEEQIREKRALSKKLNDALDSRIISINLLLSRAEALHARLEDQSIRNARPNFQRPSSGFPMETNVLDQQNQIIELYYQKMDIDTIAQRLSVPRGEVQLVIDLKEKFIAMEQAQ